MPRVSPACELQPKLDLVRLAGLERVRPAFDRAGKVLGVDDILPAVGQQPFCGKPEALRRLLRHVVEVAVG
jgi:hypothetical protein